MTFASSSACGYFVSGRPGRMENTTYIAISRQGALRRKMDVIAGNVANMNTTGYKNEKMMFTDWIARNEDAPFRGERKLAFVQDIAMYRDMGRGAIEVTEGTFDLALDNDDGFFKVRTPNGDAYTRNGSFRLDQGGQLITNAGFPVLSDANAPLFFTEADGKVTIKGDGTVITETGEVGRIAVVRFDNSQEMNRIGNSLYLTREQERPMDDPGVVQGALEKSNVQPVVEMVEMIKVMRSNARIQRTVESENQRQREVIRKLTAQGV